MCQRVGVGKVRHLELRYLWVQERLRLKAFNLHKEATDDMTVDILTKYCEWPKIEKHCATLNLRFPGKGLGHTVAAFGIFSCDASKQTRKWCRNELIGMRLAPHRSVTAT